MSKLNEKLSIFDKNKKKESEGEKKSKTSGNDSSMNELNKMIGTLMENCSTLEKEKSELKEENKKMKEKLSKMSTAQQDMESYQTKFEDIFKEYTTLEAKNSDMKKDLDEKTKLVEVLTETKKKDAETLSALENQVRRMKELIEEKEKENDILKKEIEFVKNMPKEDQLQRIERQKHQIEIERNQLDLELQEKKDKLKVLTESNIQLSAQLNDIRAENEKNTESIRKRVKDQETEILQLKEERAKKEGAYNDISSKLDESLSFIKKLQTENQELKTSTDKVKSEAYAQVEEMKEKLNKASESLFSNEQIKELYSEHLHMLYLKEYSLSYQDIIDKTIVNFNSIVEGCFNANNSENMATPLTIMHDNIKDIFFLIYSRAYENKMKCASTTGGYIALNSLDVSPELITELAIEFFSKNSITKLTHSSKEIIDAYIAKISSMKLNEDCIKGIKESFIKKVDKTKHCVVNSIRSLIEKCSKIITNGTIELNHKLLFDFRSFVSEGITLTKGNLYIDNATLTTETAELLMNIIKYPKENVLKVQFVGAFNFEKISEGTIMKILLCIMCNLPNILSLSITGCDGLSFDMINDILFTVENLKNLKILNLESNKLTDDDVKVICESLKNNRTILALFLSKNEIGANGALYISDCLSTNKTIERLFLGGNHLAETGLNSLLTVIASSNQKINFLDLSNNEFTKQEFMYIGEFLNRNPTLNTLNLSNNPIEMQGCIRLGTGMSNAKNVKNIILSNMNIIPETSPFVFKSFYVEELNIDDNELVEVGYMMFAKALSLSPNLKKLSMKNTKVTQIGLDHLLGAIGHSSTLTEIHMENNKIEEKGCDMINTFVKGKNKKFYLTRSDVVVDKFKDPFGKVENVIFV